MYSTYEMPFAGVPANTKRPPSDRAKIVILGGGPNRIGQGIEFDYCCCHASFALRAVGYETIMINCNPETVSTDYDTSDRLYFEPLTAEDVLEILDMEREQGTLSGAIVQFGGQTPLKLARAHRARRNSILGTASIRSILPRTATASSACSTSSGSNSRGTASPIPSSNRGSSPPISACRSSRPSYVLGGRAMAILHDESASTIISSRPCPASFLPTLRRAIPTTRRGRSTRCSAKSVTV